MTLIPHKVIEGVVGALYSEKSGLSQIIRSEVLTPINELTGEPFGITTIQSFYIEQDDELGQKFYDEKGVQHNVHALGLTFMHNKYDMLTEEEAIHAVRDEVFEYFSALEAYPFMKKIEKKHHEARNNPNKVFGEDANKIGR